ncbi:hypothetical protein HYALB_00002163 [Hymenoscyphus albidus]|uniref:Amino acid transporter n=1 Tax=Hymenoscyphus albidus TaxID=595503 RepID=A0A9N9LP06_9HELO|nr:hypothetical protein HYALB_00002163 [Hymenoscyphus albidus]
METDMELKDRNVAHALNGGPYTNVERNGTNSHNSDVEKLDRMGKKQILKTVLALFASGLYKFVVRSLPLFSDWFQTSGGPTGLLYGFIIAWLCTLSVYTVISELASIAPIAGGQYFWVSMLAPKGQKQFYSYITGAIYVCAIIRGMVILNHPEYSPKAWHATLLSWGVIAVCIFLNTVISKWLPKVEGFILIFHILGFFAILITVVYMAPHGSARSVFLTSLNGGGWSSQGPSFCVGFIGNVATFVGESHIQYNTLIFLTVLLKVPMLRYMSSVHMAEEIENAAVNVPRAIFTTMVLNGAMGFAMMLAILFCIGDAEEVLATETGFPFIQIFYNVTGSKSGTTVMACLVTALSWAGTIGFTATASRMLWSFARDRGVPFHRTVMKVERRTQIPMVAVGVVTTLPALLALIYIGSRAVFNDVVSLSVSGFYASYLLPSALLLWRRTTGQVAEAVTLVTEGNATVGRGGEKVLHMPLVWGPWRVPGILGIANNAFACVYMVYVIFWSFWPSATPVTPESMNYSVLVTGSVIIFSVAYYILMGKNQYVGPLVDSEVIIEDIERT